MVTVEVGHDHHVYLFRSDPWAAKSFNSSPQGVSGASAGFGPSPVSTTMFRPSERTRKTGQVESDIVVFGEMGAVGLPVLRRNAGEEIAKVKFKDAVGE